MVSSTQAIQLTKRNHPNFNSRCSPTLLVFLVLLEMAQKIIPLDSPNGGFPIQRMTKSTIVHNSGYP